MIQSFENALFISDIHLTEDRPDVVRAFFDFLRWIPESTEALFILGDFFEYWVGDDATSDLANQVAIALAHIANSAQIQIFFVAGNRDFALGKRYASRCQMTVLADESHFKIANRQVVVTHGDQYCSDDVSYQRFRAVIRHPLVLSALLGLPKKYRVRLAERLRARSKFRFQTNPVYIDVNEQTIAAAFARLGCQLMIHGHTHRADIHTYEHDKAMHTRLVLGDWHHLGWYAQLNATGHSLHQFAIAQPVF
ncbi:MULTISPECIES: UDP-2,3-diacylglucosamine diphosphatase [Reinekea]|jgi:UDP-2,3-diacylglucosamine hydrolase|uniref:UDP-2,3-diacylglucosamine diphosphatase n=1 Tax=Reinekea TaxID=230494 RepID=UPI0023528F7F|nr:MULTISPECIES: UDP-2,3-diacylglucosamine diphosphatase [Reinekea]